MSPSGPKVAVRGLTPLRWPGAFFALRPPGIRGTCLFVVACLIYDRAAHGRVHPAFLWGGLFVMLSLPLRAAIGHTDAWVTFAGWLTR
jgi:drug/metabolite transporter superfamily protein YnfA